MGFLKILVTIVELLPVVGNVLAILGKKKAEKRADTYYRIGEAVIQGVEAADRDNRLNVKTVIRNTATNLGVEDDLHDLVKKITR